MDIVGLNRVWVCIRYKEESGMEASRLNKCHHNQESITFMLTKCKFYHRTGFKENLVNIISSFFGYIGFI